MTKQQRLKYEMFVRVRDYGAAHTALFPATSPGGAAFANVTSAVAAIDEALKNSVVAAADGRKVKTTTRTAVFTAMKTIALAARRVMKTDTRTTPFRMPLGRSVKTEIDTARAFIQEATKRQEPFVEFGLPPTFISDLQTLVDQLQQAVDVRLNSKTARGEARSTVRTKLAQGLDAIRDLDAIVTIRTTADPVTFAAWRAARHIEGQTSAKPAPAKPSAPAVVPPAPVVAPAPAADAVHPPAAAHVPADSEVALAKAS